MNLDQELQHRITAAVNARAGLRDLRAWLGAHVQDVEDANNQEMGRLAGHAWALLAEYEYGHRDEESVQTELRNLLLFTVSPRERSSGRTRAGQ